MIKYSYEDFKLIAKRENKKIDKIFFERILKSICNKLKSKI